MKTEAHLGGEHATKMAELHMLLHRAKQMGNDDGESTMIQQLIEQSSLGRISPDDALMQARHIINSKQV